MVSAQLTAAEAAGRVWRVGRGRTRRGSPAAGGTGFTEAVQGIFSLNDDSVVWRLLCLAAVILSAAAALATNFANSHALADRVTAAETANAQLDGLQDTLNFGHTPIDDALKLYQQYIAQVPFVDDVPAR